VQILSFLNLALTNMTENWT